MDELVLTYDRLPWTVNFERKGGSDGIGESRGLPHHLARADLVSEWRSYFAAITNNAIRRRKLQVPWAQIFCRVTLESNAPGPLQDPGACFPAYKAALDGVKDGRLILDDGPSIVKRVIFDAPERADRTLFTLTVRRVA